MGLYDDRLADLSESRRSRVARPVDVSAKRPPTSVQSLLFDRSAGWTVTKAKAWAKSHGYKYGKADVTDQYVRIRQFNPKGSKVKRTIPFGRGIRAVVARESTHNMAKTVQARRRRRHRKTAAPKRRHRRARKVRAVQARRRRRRVRVEAKVATRRRRRRVAAAPVVQTRRRRRRRVHVKAWRGNRKKHATAARKGWRRRKHSRRRRRVHSTVMEAPRRRRRRRVAAAAAPVQARRRRRHHMHASRGGAMGAMELGIAVVTGGVGFLAADGLDRFLATYDPSATGDKPKDKFVSDGAGTLANTLNIARMPGWVRAGAGVGMVAVPAVGASFVRNRTAKAALEGFALGAGISAVQKLWNNVLMPLLIGKDTSAPALQKSFIARLYPAEVAAKINMDAQKGADGKTAPGPYASSGVLSGHPDVGPFALAGDSPYASAEQALRRAAGLSGDSPYPDAAQALRRAAGVGGDSPYPNADQALRRAAGLGWEPGPPPGQGAGPAAEPHKDSNSCGCVGDQYATFLGSANEEPLVNIG